MLYKDSQCKSELSEPLHSHMKLHLGSMHTVWISITYGKKIKKIKKDFFAHTVHVASESQGRICSLEFVLSVKSFESLLIIIKLQMIFLNNQ